MEEEKARTPAVRCRQRRTVELNIVVFGWEECYLLGMSCVGFVQHDGERGGWEVQSFTLSLYKRMKEYTSRSAGSAK